MMSARLPGSSVAPPSRLVKRAITDTIGVPSVHDKNTSRLVAKPGWNAMPSKPPSEASLKVGNDAEMSMKSASNAATFGAFANTRTRPEFSKTQQTKGGGGGRWGARTQRE